MLHIFKQKTLAILYIILISVLHSCDNNKCPEGAIPILDANGDVIDCIDENPGNR